MDCLPNVRDADWTLSSGSNACRGKTEFSPAYAVFDAENGRQLATGLATDVEQTKKSALSVARAKLAEGFGTDFN